MTSSRRFEGKKLFSICLRRVTFCHQRQKVTKKRRLKPKVSKLPRAYRRESKEKFLPRDVIMQIKHELN